MEDEKKGVRWRRWWFEGEGRKVGPREEEGGKLDREGSTETSADDLIYPILSAETLNVFVSLPVNSQIF